MQNHDMRPPLGVQRPGIGIRPTVHKINSKYAYSLVVLLWRHNDTELLQFYPSWTLISAMTWLRHDFSRADSSVPHLVPATRQQVWLCGALAPYMQAIHSHLNSSRFIRAPHLNNTAPRRTSYVIFSSKTRLRLPSNDSEWQGPETGLSFGF